MLFQNGIAVSKVYAKGSKSLRDSEDTFMTVKEQEPDEYPFWALFKHYNSG